MKVLNSIQTNLDNANNLELIAVLDDIAHNIEIRDDFSIRHPSYRPLEIPAEAVERFQQMPEQTKQKFLSLRLRSFIYGIFYNGSMREALAPSTKEQILQLDLENNSLLGIDTAFLKRLHDSNYGQGFFDSNWIILKKKEENILVVKKHNLKIYVQREKHLLEAEKEFNVGDTVAIKMPKNRMQNGFYVAVSNLGFSRPSRKEILVRVYFNLTTEGAVTLMQSLTRDMNQLDIPFSFKTLYSPKEYERFDSGVLYFNKSDYKRVAESIKRIYSECRECFKPEVPLFTKRLALGIGLAEEPIQKFTDVESFGMNRCQIVANGLIKLHKESCNLNRLKVIENEFINIGLSMKKAYINTSSDDIYTLLT